MPKKKTLTEAQLKVLLIARFNAEKISQRKLQVRLQQELGNEVQEEDPIAIAIERKITDWISGVLARRLKRNQHATPLLSSQDFAHIAPSLVKEIADIEDDELNPEERKMLEDFSIKMFKNILEMMVYAMVPPRFDPYDEYWRWVSTVHDIAAERKIQPTELFTLEGTTDEITRRMFSKKQFISLSKRAIKKFADPKVLMEIFLRPILDMFAPQANEDEQLVFERQLKAEIMPKLRDTVEKSKVIINTFLDEEAKRIYAVS